jgi:hypothetical protein
MDLRGEKKRIRVYFKEQSRTSVTLRNVTNHNKMLHHRVNLPPYLCYEDVCMYYGTFCYTNLHKTQYSQTARSRDIHFAASACMLFTLLRPPQLLAFSNYSAIFNIAIRNITRCTQHHTVSLVTTPHCCVCNMASFPHLNLSPTNLIILSKHFLYQSRTSLPHPLFSALPVPTSSIPSSSLRVCICHQAWHP